MSGDLWGVARGMQIADQEQSQRQMQALAQRQGEQNLQHGQQNLEKGAQELESGRMQLDQAKQTIDSQKKMMEMMKGQSAETSLPDRLEAMADFALKINQPDKAREYASTASAMRKNAKEIQSADLDDHLKTLGVGRQLVQAVKAVPEDQRPDAWAKANHMFEMITGRKSAFGGMEYSPEVLDMLETQMGDKEKEITIKQKESQIKDAEAVAKERNARVPLIDSQRRLADAQAANLAKQGVVIQDADLKPVADRINAEYGQALSPEEARTIGRTILARQRELVTGNKLDSEEALSQAMAEEKSNGGLKDVTPEFTKGPKAVAAGKEAALSEIDDLITTLKKDPSVAGARGFVSRVGETVKTTTGEGSQKTPANEFQTAMELFLLRLPKIAGSNRESQGRVDKIASALKLGVTAPIAVGKLEELKRVLSGGEQKAPAAEERTAYDKTGKPVIVVKRGDKWVPK